MPRTKTLHAIFDGNVLRPEESVDLEPNARYLIAENHRKQAEDQYRYADKNRLCFLSRIITLFST